MEFEAKGSCQYCIFFLRFVYDLTFYLKDLNRNREPKKERKIEKEQVWILTTDFGLRAVTSLKF